VLSVLRIVVACTLLLPMTVFAAAGDLDPGFGGDGIVVTTLPGPFTWASSVVQQADGKLVAAGTANNQFVVVRYLPDGTLDTSFDGDGTTTGFSADNYAEAWDLIQQSDGKLLVAGAAEGNFALARYHSNGSLDNTFGSGGLVTTGFDNLSSISAVTQQRDGNLLAAGATRFFDDDDNFAGSFTLARYLATGALDTSFGTAGKVITDVKVGVDRISDVIEQEDGKLVAVGFAGGYQGINGNEDIAIVRYLPDGSLDTSFGVDGLLMLGVFTDDINVGGDRASSVIQLADGRLLVAGYGEINSTPMVMVCLLPDGSLDTNFGNNGVASGPMDFRAVGLVQQADNKLVLSGSRWNGTGSDYAWVRYEPNGSIDASFGVDGMVVLPSAQESDFSYAVSPIQQYDGKLVVALFADGPDVDYRFSLARIESGQIIRSVKNDYNNDGIAGWIWKGVSNGNETQSQNWQLTFPLHSNNWAVPNRFYHPVFPDQANWDIVTTGDFNKDDDADILWRNNATAQWKVWQTQNGIRSAQNDLADFDLAHEWQVIGAGDTDKDGDDDVILNNTTSGEVRIWKMENHAIGASYNIGTKAGYILNRIGDFNKDGDVDLLFRQNGSDVLITWELEANAFVTERALANTGAGYNPVCAGDFDKDGDDDIMLINSATTQEKWFVMENYTRSQKVGSTNAGFVFKGCGDYDGDGDADALWQRSSDDANRVVLQQNFGTTKQTVYTNAFGGANGFVYRGNSN
jgi:uncharacterized delta-60 repeat protein